MNYAEHRGLVILMARQDTTHTEWQKIDFVRNSIFLVKSSDIICYFNWQNLKKKKKKKKKHFDQIWATACQNQRMTKPTHDQRMTKPTHDKTNEMICAPSEDSDQPRHPPSLIIDFTVRTKKHWAIGYP